MAASLQEQNVNLQERIANSSELHAGANRRIAILERDLQTLESDHASNLLEVKRGEYVAKNKLASTLLECQTLKDKFTETEMVLLRMLRFGVACVESIRLIAAAAEEKMTKNSAFRHFSKRMHPDSLLKSKFFESVKGCQELLPDTLEKAQLVECLLRFAENNSECNPMFAWKAVFPDPKPTAQHSPDPHAQTHS